MLPGSPRRRLISRPDLRHIVTPRLSGAALGSDEVDYDELSVLRAWRTYEPDRPGEVRYFMLEVSQQNPGETTPWVGYKAVRFARLSRVPRWLRQQGSGVGRPGFSQMSYVLAALREQGVLFVQLVTKTPDTQLIFAYGVQALGSTPEEAQARCDEAYASLCALLDGTFQQIEYVPLSMSEGERIARQQATWTDIAVARGRPVLNSESIGAAGLLDGNRTDLEGTQQMEAFIRGMSESRRGFMLTLVTVPLAVEDMNIAVSNVARHLSVVRSETRGNRAFMAGVALPLAIGSSVGTGESDSHTRTDTLGSGTNEGWSSVEGTSTSQSVADSTTQTTSVSDSVTNTTSVSDSVTNTDSVSDSTSRATSVSDSISTAVGTGTSQSVADGTSSSTASSLTNTTGSSTGSTTTEGTATSSTNTTGTSLQNSESASSSKGSSGGVGLVGGNLSATDSSGVSRGSSSSQATGSTASSSTASSSTASSSVATGLTDTTGTSRTTTAGTSTNLTDTTGRTTGVSDTTGRTTGSSDATGRTTGSSESTGRTTGSSESTGRTVSTGTGTSSQNGLSGGSSSSQSVADAYAVALSRQASQTGSLGVVPSFGVSVSKETLDAGKQLIGDILEETMRRYVDGVEGGAYLYQMFLTAEDRETLVSAASLLKSAFWGPGGLERRLAQPFHVVTNPAEIVSEQDADAERERLLSHAHAFSSYRRREPTMEIIEPFVYSSYVTVGELSAFARPPVAESLGLLAVHDSAPVMAMPGNRHDREISLGYVFNGERGRVSNMRFGVDTDELTHTLIAGATGVGKTTTLLRLLSELVGVERTIIDPPTPSNPAPRSRTVGASVLALDWMRNMRHLGSLMEPVSIDPVTGERRGRFQFYSVRDRELGAFMWNPLAIPTEGMNPVEWLNATSDNMVASWNLGEFGRALIAEFLDRLYSANRLEPFVLRPERRDELGNLVRPAIVLDPIDPVSLPPAALATDELTGATVANVYSYPALSRLVGVQHLAVLVAAELEAAATVEGGRQGTSLRDRLQSLWRRVSYFAPGGQLANIISCDISLNDRVCLTLDDIVAPDEGLVTVIETDGLDLANRRFILGSLMLAVYRGGLHRGEGCYNQDGRGPGLYMVLEEAHEIFGDQGDDDDRFSASTRTALAESMHRRIRALGAVMIDVVQNAGDIPEAITSNTSTVFVHRSYGENDRKRLFSLLNWSNQIGQQLREFRFLGEMPVGHVIARLHARHHFLESAPVHFVTTPASLGKVTDAQLAEWHRRRS
jgi:DNA helicase HerA-like ATPase